jgi:hypothetical protein
MSGTACARANSTACRSAASPASVLSSPTMTRFISPLTGPMPPVPGMSVGEVIAATSLSG